MVLLSFKEFQTLKSNSDKYIQQSKEIKEVEKQTEKITTLGTSKQGFGDVVSNTDNYAVKVAEELPSKFKDSKDIYEALNTAINDADSYDCSSEISLVPKIHKATARKLVQELRKKKSIKWGSEGEISLSGKKINGSRIKELLPKVFRGIRAGANKGEEDFIKYLQDENLSHYVKSVSDKDWFYIGKP